MRLGGKFEREIEVATYAVMAAGAAVLELYAGAANAQEKAGGSPVTDADLAANRIIVAALSEAFPNDAMLSEESADSSARLSAHRVWIVDPLDGTKEYISRNGEFTIMIGLAIDGRAVAGLVLQPTEGLLYVAAQDAGSWSVIGGEASRLQCGAGTWPPRMVGSRSHPDQKITAIQEELQISDIAPSGSVGLKCSLVARNLRDLYVHPVPYLKEWDTCAPEVILREAGGSVTDCFGEALRYNKPDPHQPAGILAADPATHERVLPTVVRIMSA